MNNTQEYFRKSEGAGIDDDNFTNPGSGEGFDSGRDFAPSPITETESSRNSDRNTYEPPENDESDEPDFETPDFSEQQAEWDAFRATLDTRNAEIAQIREFHESILDEDNLVFDSEYYLEQNPDLQIHSEFAQSHFEEGGTFRDSGMSEGREYRFLLKDNYTPAPNILAANYSYPGSINYSSGYDDILHFDREYYLDQNPDVAADGVGAGAHFIAYGQSEDREHRYVLSFDLLIWDRLRNEYEENSADSLSGASESVVGGEQDFGSGTVAESEFDRQYYLAENPDVAAAGVDPYEHYVAFGQAEGRIPYAELELGIASESEFDSQYYLAENPDVAAAGVDPYEHYVAFGQAEGRIPHADFG